MPRKKLDPRIRTLIQNGIRTNHRSLFVIIGDHGRDQVVNLHYILTKAQVARRPSVLWCYKKELGFSSHKQKRIKAMRRKQRSGKTDVDEEDPFELFVSSTDIRYAYYKETDRILGKTFGMCVLQDFEALEPNYLARTIETVQGGGMVVLLIRTLTSLKQLYTMVMDVHARYRSGDHKHDAVARFNERFLLSLASCETCLVLDDKLDVLPITSRSIDELAEPPSPEFSALAELKKDSAGAPTGKLIALAKTMDQANVITVFTEIVTKAVQDGTLRSTVSLTAGRGRGKSAALGLAIAASLHAGLSNIFLTSPSPENLGTLFEFLFKGLDALGYEEHLDYEIIQSTYAEFNKAIVRVNIKRRGQGTRQTVLYISPQDSHLLGQAELVVIDEAAAIPLPLIQKLITGPYLVFLSSTINGYEGTGRSLSLKLLHNLRSNPNKHLQELHLTEPIRYAPGDPIENWLNALLCLDCQSVLKPASGTLPHPERCELFQVNRDTLFSHHKASEAFLQRMMSLYVASHYKNSPNDLQLMSDAPGHRLFVLLGPTDPASASLPDILAVLQVAFEGRLTRESVLRSLQRGKRDAGDLIPWTMSTQFMDNEFGEMSGARVVRIAVHPEMQSMGYGGRALEQLVRFYSGEFGGTEEADDDKTGTAPATENDTDNDLMTGRPKPRTNLAPLLLNVVDIKQRPLHWLGTSFGLTPQLFKFWHKHAFLPTYLRQTANDITGEHTMLMLRALGRDAQGVTVNPTWLPSLNKDFAKRLSGLLSGPFRLMSPMLSLSVLNYGANNHERAEEQEEGVPILSALFTAHDLHRLESYASNTSELYLISDLLPTLSTLHFSPTPSTPLQSAVHLSPVQAAILLIIGLQRRDVVDAERELGLPRETIMAMTVKCIRKMITVIKGARLSKLTPSEPPTDPNALLPKNTTNLPSIEEDLQSGASAASKELADRQARLLSTLNLSQYEIDVDGEALEKDLRGRKNFDGVVSVKGNGKQEKRERPIVDQIAKTIDKDKKKRPILKR